MQLGTTLTEFNEQDITGKETPESGMEDRSQSGSSFSIGNMAISILALILGVVGGLLASVASNSEWKGKMEQRIQTLEAQRSEDKATWDYIRGQNEVNGKALARIEAGLEARKGR